ncbi:MAG: DUF3108 domain-containing protein, partial [Kiritimatiellales bacterium]|nr:DUF3108 domain-containing protein [Kiritimatiellales bacterium]
LAGLLLAGTCAASVADWFNVGEEVEYKVTWMHIPVAWSRVTLDTIEENGRELPRIRVASKSYSTFNHIYKVDDLFETVIDPETRLPLRHGGRLSEGSRRKDHMTVFHHDRGIAVFEDRLTGEKTEVPINADTLDIFSLMFAMRDMDISELGTTVHKVFTDGKLYNLKLSIKEDTDISLENYNKVPCFEVEPTAEFDGLFVRQGRITFWVSKINRRMVTCIQAKVPVGKIRVKLHQVSGPGDDFWITGETAEKEEK